ncbi:dienelactone hydrolase family protein [Sphingomonas sabuli]|uniref:Dienelactone hydrolase family protein n=1 Tax=Sphingomonas sabuli TaxID=2764186 RepID=A0A7G9L1W6_9SPHN|nr:dienelactone hydrolase family protein [Sphingomonas sabuli]QNM82615.1 dienelactone hydrolase family protein [Sphingomonas sabuli]
MKRALKILGGVVLVLLLVVAGLALYVYQSAIEPKRPVGFQQIAIADPGHSRIAAGVWYPTTAKPGFMLLGSGGQRVATNGPVDGARLPLIIFSHGTAGSAVSHADTAIALAENGFIVIAPTHPGDTFETASDIEPWLLNRTRHIQKTIDGALTSWKDRAHVDAQRIGIFGFSAGATTGLIAIGGRPDLSRIYTECAAHSEFICKTTLPKRYENFRRTSWPSDGRIRAAVLAAPGLGFTFDAASLSGVNVPVQLWGGTADQTVPLPTNAKHIANLLGAKAEMHAVPNAVHFSFLMPCGLIGPRELCSDPKGFARAAFHQQFNADVVRFFKLTMGP